MHHIRRFTFVGMLMLFFVALPVLAQGTVNPNANISWPPPIYVLRGDFEIRGSASLPNMTNYFLEFRPINEDLTVPSQSNWFPATVPSRRVVQDGVLGVWDTTVVEDGAYELRLTVNVRGGQPVFDIVSPLRIENSFSSEGGGVLPTPTATQVVPTQLPATPTFDPTPRATVSVARGNVRTGDGTNYPAVAQVTEGAVLLIVGISNRNTGWYQVRLPNGTIGWVAPSIVNVSGNLNTVPLVAPPPPPATPTPTVSVNLVAGNAFINPFPPVCAQTFSIGFDVANLGTTPTTAPGLVTVQDIRAADGTVQQTTSGAFPIIQPGQTFRVDMRLTVSTWFNEQHRLIITVDPGNQIAETNEGDNVRVVDYVLQPGGCSGATLTPTLGVNLVANNPSVSPFPPICNQQFIVGIDVANVGTEGTRNGGTVTVQDTRAADGQQQGIASANFGTINPGQTVNVTVPLTVTTWFNEVHRLVITVDSGNQIGETNEGDNVRVVEYTLQQGGCG
jgi:uncharacterized protein YgiM (DUF1202 family)